MTDRELLERAAKAADLRIDTSATNGGGPRNTGFDILGRAVLDWHNDITWDPISDDGDNRRLQIKIGAKAWFERNAPPEMKLPRECGVAVVGDRWWAVTRTGGMSEEEAVRRAVVLAAAEIGLSQPPRDVLG